jgi:PAS domain S-box-containing protein
LLQHQRAAAALRESEEHYRSVIAALQEGVVVWDADSRLRVCNASAERILGLSTQELEERRSSRDPRMRAIYEDGTPFSRETYPGEVALRTGQPSTNVVMGVYQPNGELTWIAVNSQPLFRARELTPYAVVTSFLDITRRRRAEEELRLANARVELAVRGSDIGIWDNDFPDGDFRHGRLSYVNIWERLGYERPDLPSDHETGMAPVHPDDRPRLEEAIRSYLVGQTSKFEIETRARHKDGSYRWMLARGVAVRDAAGRPIRFTGSGVDITDRKRAEEALRESEERFRGTFENAAVGIAHVGIGGRFLRVNERFCTIVGYPRDELLQRSALEIAHPDDRTASAEQSAALLRGASPGFTVQKRYVRPDGSLVWAELCVSLQRDAAGNPDYFIGVIQDISERKRLEGELRRAVEAAEAANRAKDDFLANVSHEIRTPMNGILGMTELALDTPLTGDQRQCLGTVKSAADNLLGLINALLDFAKIEAGKLELDAADFSLRAAVGDALRALAARAHKKGLELICHVQPEVPDALIGDAGRLRQVLLNLVGNAIKFTEHGEVVVRVEVASGGCQPPGEEEQGVDIPRSPVLRFTVRDTGIGIPPDKQERIFRAFEQEDTSTTRKYGGTGPGLTIAARLVALMGGSIAVQSEPGRGSSFAFTARFGRQSHPPGQVAVRPPVLLKGLRVLVVDDNPTNRHILQEWLTGWHMEPVAVGNGLAAMGALWDAVSIGRPFPLVLLDARMPDTDGLALAARIRERAALSAVPIILLTSDQRPGDLARSRALRIDAHLLKPVQQDELLETIYRVLQEDEGGRMKEESEAGALSFSSFILHPSSFPLRILLAEDDEFSAQLMDKLLGRRGHRVRLASNGREALALAGQGTFDLMLLDVHMPELDGFEVVRAIGERERDAGGHLPVVALTARSSAEDRERCLAAGMDDFLTKPVSAAGLLAVIDRLVPAHGVSRPARAEAGGHAGLLDPVAVLTTCGDDAEALRAMCQALETYLPVRVVEVGDAMRAGDAPRLREAAHKLCALLFAFSRTAGNAALELEDHAAQGRLEEAMRMVERLEAMARELLPLVGGLSLETLRRQAQAADDPDRAGAPSTQRDS